FVTFAGQGKPMPQFGYADFEQTNPGAPPWQGDYRFTFTVEFPNEEVSRQFKSNPAFSTFGVTHMLQQPDSFGYLGHLEVTKGTRDEAKELRYQVTSRGTKVENLRGWKHEPSLIFGALPLRFAHGPLGAEVFFIEGVLVNGFGAWIGILV